MNPIEILREKVITEVLSLNTMQNVWPTWSAKIHSLIDHNSISSKSLITIGENLYDIFTSTSNGRGQSDVSAGGAAWEGLICWYLNLCLL